jgi:crotonobetainyl-CoA:carnitine CoA-transferase CaiB-like acyl-CoA transferase
MTSSAESALLVSLAVGVGLRAGTTDSFAVAVTGQGNLESFYPVSALAETSIAVAGRAAAELRSVLGLGAAEVEVDRALADAWFGLALRPIGWELPSPWDPIAGDYRALHDGEVDGWIRLHTNAPHHRAAALRVLGVPADRAAVADAVASWDAGELESAVVAEGGCAAELRTPAAWAAHPQGAALAAEPLVHRDRTDLSTDAAPTRWAPTEAAPLAGLRVLDLTRVLAGPVATRLLAGLGAQVLRVDPPSWDEPALVPEMTLGKRAARLDARDPAGREQLLELLAGADVLVSGYRADALERLGLGEAVRRRIRPGLVDVSLDAYGHTGPWAGRRGFDSLVQMSSGIAGAGLDTGIADRPTPLPVQALDHATGYLTAAAVLVGLADRVSDGIGTRSRLSLARTAVELERARGLEVDAGAPAPAWRTTPLDTPWGAAEVLPSPLTVGGHPLAWSLPPRPLGSDDPLWA